MNYSNVQRKFMMSTKKAPPTPNALMSHLDLLSYNCTHIRIINLFNFMQRSDISFFQHIRNFSIIVTFLKKGVTAATNSCFFGQGTCSEEYLVQHSNSMLAASLLLSFPVCFPGHWITYSRRSSKSTTY